jgi:hypothetical protein
VTSDQKFGKILHDKYFMIDKSLYALETPPVRFHGHLSESFLWFGFKKTKNYPDLWIMDKSSHN